MQLSLSALRGLEVRQKCCKSAAKVLQGAALGPSWCRTAALAALTYKCASVVLQKPPQKRLRHTNTNVN
jgi:hypothetical protein